MNINRGTPNTISTPKYTKLFKSCFCFLISVRLPIIYAPFLSTLSFRIICFLPGTFSKFHTLKKLRSYLNSQVTQNFFCTFSFISSSFMFAIFQIYLLQINLKPSLKKKAKANTAAMQRTIKKGSSISLLFFALIFTNLCNIFSFSASEKVVSNNFCSRSYCFSKLFKFMLILLISESCRFFPVCKITHNVQSYSFSICLDIQICR